MSELPDIVVEIRAIAQQAGDIALRSFGRVSPEVKADASYVTAADRAVEEFIRRELSTRFPGERIIGEEFDDENDGESEHAWAIDPIDGTTNFVAGLPLWGVCIARLRSGKPEIGVVNAPALDELYSAVDGQGAVLNGRALELVRRDGPENEQLLAVWSSAFRKIDVVFPGKLRVLGSTVMKALYTARGSYVGALTPEVHVWDIAAGLPVLWEAGGGAWTREGERYEVMDLDPTHGYLVPPLVLSTEQAHGRVRTMFRQRS